MLHFLLSFLHKHFSTECDVLALKIIICFIYVLNFLLERLYHE